MRRGHKSKTTHLDFNVQKSPGVNQINSSPRGATQNFSPVFSEMNPSPHGATQAILPVFSETNPSPHGAIQNLFSTNETDQTTENNAHFLHTKNDHLIMETINSQGEDAVSQCLSTVPCVEHLIFCHDEQKLDVSPAVHNFKFGEESAIVSTKRNLEKEKKRQPVALFSATHGHLGCQNSNCPACARKMGNEVKLQNPPNCSMKERKEVSGGG
jgi:hypothetical protein